MDISVLTSITSSKDYLVEQDRFDVKHLAYLDAPYSSETWEIREAPSVFTDPRRNSRIPKLLPHLYTDTEYSVWIDGNMSLTKSPVELAERYLKDHDIALFKHPKRDCVYDEAIRCATSNLDDPETIIKQVTRYELSGYAKHKGLCECGFILRKHTPKVIEFNNYWFAEYANGSVRDQISFMYAADKVGLRIKTIDEPWYLQDDGINVGRSDFIQMVPHTILNPQVQ